MIIFPGKIDEKATQLHAIASLKVLLDATKSRHGTATSTSASHANNEANDLSGESREICQKNITSGESTVDPTSYMNGRMSSTQDTSDKGMESVISHSMK